MLRIRLTRVGKKNSPAYRVVVADKRRAVKRKFIEIIGNYNPTMKPKTIVIDKDRALFWINLGAQPSDTVNNLMCDLGILDKKDKINKVYGKKTSKKAAKEGGDSTEPEKVAEEAAVAEEIKEDVSVEIEAPIEPEAEVAEEPEVKEIPEETIADKAE